MILFVAGLLLGSFVMALLAYWWLSAMNTNDRGGRRER
jgi:hypothetical protein